MEIALAPALRTSPAIVSLLTRTTATETYTLSLHDALPISRQRARREPTPRAGPGAPAVCRRPRGADAAARAGAGRGRRGRDEARRDRRSEEHTSELQSLTNLVCRLLLEKKKPTPWRSRSPQHCVHLRLSFLC